MSVTIKDIALKARVSYATVSRALSDHPEIKDETKQLVRKIAKEMGYAPNAIAKGLVTRNTYTIGLLIPDITNPFFPEVAQGIENYASSNGYKVFLCNSNWDMQKEKEYLDILYGSRVDGIVVAPVSDDLTQILDIGKSIPVVFAAYNPRIEGCNYVVTDDVTSASIAVEYLIKLGHEKIAYLGGPKNNSTNIGRYSGYRDTLEKNGISLKPDYVKFGQYKHESGYQLTRDMLVHNDLPTAILAGNDVMALGVIQAIEEFGLEVPNDISVVGFDDISFAGLDKIQLSTVYQPKYQIGQSCVEILLEKKNKCHQNEALKKIMEPELIIRKTCRKV